MFQNRFLLYEQMKSWVLLSLCLFPLLCFAQIPTQGSTDSLGNEEDIFELFPVEDTIDAKYFFIDNPGEEFAFQDTLLDHFQQYDPIRREDYDVAHLGFLGSAHQPILFQPTERQGFDIGLHQFDRYLLFTDDLPYYRSSKPFTNLFFSQGPNQNASNFEAQFTRTFTDGINFALEYRRTNNEGQYQSQRALNTSLVAGLWYHHPKGKYDSFFSYTYNEIRNRDNGGIRTDELTLANIQQEFTVPIFLDNVAQTRMEQREFSILQYYNFVAQQDSSGRETRRGFLASHHFLFIPGEYKFADDNPASDSIYYGDLQVDNRGLRMALRYSSLENTIKLLTRKGEDGDSEQEVKRQRDLLEVGLTHRATFLRQEPESVSTINNLFLTGRWHFAPGEYLNFRSFAQLGLWDNAGDYRLEGKLDFDFQSVGELSLAAISQAYTPSLLQRKIYVSKQLVWDENFDKIFETSLMVNYSLPAINISLSGQYHLLGNWVYYDVNGFPQQEGDIVNVVQFIAEHRLKFWRFQLDNQIILQEVSGEALRLPRLYTKHSLFFNSKIFRGILDFQLGVDLRLNDSYLANTYQPLTGQFIQQDDLEVPFYPVGDAFANFKVKRLRVFVKYENITSNFTNNFFYQTAFYPNSYQYFRMGVSWQLLD